MAVVLCILFQSNTFGRKKSELIIEEVDLKNKCIYATAKNQLYYLGIDAGSTTTKVALVGEDGSLLYRFYSNNNGSPLATAIRAMQEIQDVYKRQI